MSIEAFTVDEFEHAGLTVRIVAEQEFIPEIYNPRECDQLGTMFVSYPGYNLGDEQLPDDGFAEIDCPVCKLGELPIYGPPQLSLNSGMRMVEWKPECPRCESVYGFMVEPTVEEWLADQNAICAMPLFVYEHSGITMRTGSFRMIEEERITREDTRSTGRFMGDDAGWDTSFVGFIITTRERCEELGVEITAENLERQLDSEVKEYAMYLEGDCGGYVIEDEDGEHLDSCWGFLGLHEDYVREEAKSAAEYCRKDIEAESLERAEWAARDVMTV